MAVVRYYYYIEWLVYNAKDTVETFDDDLLLRNRNIPKLTLCGCTTSNRYYTRVCLPKSPNAYVSIIVEHPTIIRNIFFCL